MITWTNERRKLSDLVPWDGNPRQINDDDAQRLAESLSEFGQIQTIAIGPDDEILDGHQRRLVWSASQEFGPDYEIDVRVASRALTEEERQKLVVFLHKGTMGDWDWDAQANGIEIDDLLEWGFDEAELGLAGFDLGGDETGEPQLTRADVPNALWPSDNEWGIPTLDLALQAQAVDLPVALWGAMVRKKRMNGTWIFYCDDYRFGALWKDPSGVVNTQCASAVEPNFTIGPQTPRAVALWQIYRKRYLARWWQSCGVRILVDMNVDTTTFADLMLLGVPKGWKAYATRGYIDRCDFTIAEYELACEHAETDNLLFLLYGGGKACQKLARERGWIYVSEHMDVKRGGVVGG